MGRAGVGATQGEKVASGQNPQQGRGHRLQGRGHRPGALTRCGALTGVSAAWASGSKCVQCPCHQGDVTPFEERPDHDTAPGAVSSGQGCVVTRSPPPSSPGAPPALCHPLGGPAHPADARERERLSERLSEGHGSQKTVSGIVRCQSISAGSSGSHAGGGGLCVSVLV